MGAFQHNTMPEEERQYGSRSYWDQRYSDPANQEAFEWLQDYKGLQEHIARECSNKSGKVLVVGTGRSNLAKDMNTDGYTEVVGVDFCGVLIDKLNAREAPRASHTRPARCRIWAATAGSPRTRWIMSSTR